MSDWARYYMHLLEESGWVHGCGRLCGGPSRRTSSRRTAALSSSWAFRAAASSSFLRFHAARSFSSSLCECLTPVLAVQNMVHALRGEWLWLVVSVREGGRKEERERCVSES